MRLAGAFALLALGLSLVVAACGGTSSGADRESGSVNLVSYSTPQELYEGEIEPAFQGTPDGEGVGFENSFGSSGEQSRAVESGLPADVVHLSLETDMTRLVDAGLVARDWNRNEHDGIVQDSVVAFTVREGNPKNIQDWDDLVTGDVEVITPNPFTSGGARWNIMAAYGAQIANGASGHEAHDYVKRLLENTPVQDKSASDALATFTGGKGDVLISYENEAIRAQRAGEKVDYVIPDDTLLIETPIAITEEAGDPETARAFVDFLYSDEGQQLYADAGYRPVVRSVLKRNEDEFPIPPGLFTIAELGGWEKVSAEFFDPDSGSIAEIERGLGVATE